MDYSKANVKEDFKKFHNLDVNELDGLAIRQIQIIQK